MDAFDDDPPLSLGRLRYKLVVWLSFLVILSCGDLWARKCVKIVQTAGTKTHFLVHK